MRQRCVARSRERTKSRVGIAAAIRALVSWVRARIEGRSQRLSRPCGTRPRSDEATICHLVILSSCHLGLTHDQRFRRRTYNHEPTQHQRRAKQLQQAKPLAK